MRVRDRCPMGVMLLLLGLLGVSAVHAEPVPTVDPTDTPAAGDPATDTDGTAPGSTGEDGFTFPPEVEALLNQGGDPEAYAETERCIMTREIRNTEILDQQHLVFELSGKRFYLVQFPRVCSGMRRGATIVYETRIGQLCRLDQIRAFDPGMGPPNPPCSLPGFIPVQKEQVALLRDSLKAQRKAELDAYKAEKAKKRSEAEKPDSAAEPDG